MHLGQIEIFFKYGTFRNQSSTIQTKWKILQQDSPGVNIEFKNERGISKQLDESWVFSDSDKPNKCSRGWSLGKKVWNILRKKILSGK